MLAGAGRDGGLALVEAGRGRIAIQGSLSRDPMSIFLPRFSFALWRSVGFRQRR